MTPQSNAHEVVRLLQLYEQHISSPDVFVLSEGKHIGTFRGSALDRQLAAGMAATLEPQKANRRRQKRTYDNRKKLRGLVSRTEQSLVQSWKRYQKERFSFRQFESSVTRYLKDAYRQALHLGLASSEIDIPEQMQKDLSGNEEKWLESFIKEEHGYLKNLMREVKRGTSRTNVEFRLKRYARTVNSVFDAARLLTAPPDTVITWRTHNVAPCPGCTTLERYSPYTVMTLPTTPKAGATPCLDHCKCTMEFKRDKPDRVIKIAERNKSRSAMLKILDRVKKTRKPG